MTKERELYFRSDRYRQSLKKGEQVMWLRHDIKVIPIRLFVGKTSNELPKPHSLELNDSFGKHVTTVSISEEVVEADNRISLFARFEDLMPEEIVELITYRLSV